MRILISTALAVGVAACSGGDGGGLTCDFTPCGGDPIGEWSFAEVCVEGAIDPPSECPTATIILRSIDVTGTVSVRADMTMSSSITQTLSASMHVPMACLPDGVTCDALTDPDEDRTCTAASDGCDCTLGPSDDVTDSTGSWSVTGNQLTLTDDGSADPPDVADFCVEGDTMRVRMTADSGLTLGYLLTK